MTDTNAVTYVSIGNSDDKLGQAEWAEYVATIDRLFKGSGWHVHGTWMSLPNAYWQNACWAVEVPADIPDAMDALTGALGAACARFRQDSIAVVTGVPTFVGPGLAQQPPREAPLPVEATEPPLCPECRNGKPDNCTGETLDAADQYVPCATAARQAAQIDALHGPGASAALDAAIADGSVFSSAGGH